MVTVRDILGIERLALTPLTTSHPDAEVRWVATSELRDPSPFLEGGEVLLTTGLLERDAQGWQRLATLAIDSGVVALGFGVGLSHPSIPPALVGAAKKVSLNLFLVPHEIPFIAITRAIADLLGAAERDADRQALSHQQLLTRAAISGGGTTAILKTLAGIVAGDLVLADARGTVLADASQRTPVDLARDALPLITRIDAAAARSSATEITSSARLTVQPVGPGATGRVDAYLLLETEAAFSPPQRTAITTAIALLALDRERTHAGEDAERRVRAGVLSLLLRGELRSAESLLATTPPGPGLPWDRAIIVRARGQLETMERALSRIEKLGTGSESALAAIVVDPGDDNSSQLVIAASDDEKQLATLLQELTGLQCGIGSVNPLSRLSDSDDAARSAVGFTSAARPVVAWTELAERGVDAIIDADALRNYANTLLKDVLDLPDSEPIMECLHSFLKHNGKVGPTAQELGVHRNTVLNRLSAAEDALTRSLQNPQLRSDLWIALTCLRARN